MCDYSLFPFPSSDSNNAMLSLNRNLEATYFLRYHTKMYTSVF